MIAAVFDLDRTLLPRTTAERVFLKYLSEQGVLGAGSLTRTVRAMLTGAGEGGVIQRIRAERPYLIGLHDAVLRLHGKRCAFQRILPALSERGIDHLLWHRAQGHRIVLLSGSLPYVVEPLGKQLQVDDVICSVMELESRRLTGRLAAPHPYGVAKASLMLELAKAEGIDLERSWCYADHHSDETLLHLFEHPVCVNPSAQLRTIADACDWHVESFN
jgi:HAD superfamily hydrolase (TIGR01490 family)